MRQARLPRVMLTRPRAGCAPAAVWLRIRCALCPCHLLQVSRVLFVLRHKTEGIVEAALNESNEAAAAASTTATAIICAVCKWVARAGTGTRDASAAQPCPGTSCASRGTCPTWRNRSSAISHGRRCHGCAANCRSVCGSKGVTECRHGLRARPGGEKMTQARRSLDRGGFSYACLPSLDHRRAGRSRGRR